MSETLLFLTDFFRIDIFVGFGFYSIIYFSLRLLLKNETFITEFDESAVQTVVYGGVIWLCLWVIETFVYYYGLENEIEKNGYYEYLTGKYSYGIWTQSIFWFLLTQLYRIKIIRRFLIFRIIISLFFTITYERFVIIVTSLHKDYLPSNWTMGYNFTLTPYWIFLGWISKILIFILLVMLYHFVIRKIKNALQQNV